MNRDLLNKLKNEQPLDTAERLDLEQALERGEASPAAQWMSQLHDEDPSMAWRSQLNAKLQEIAPAPAKKRFNWFGTSAIAAAGVCAAFALFTLNRTPVATEPQPEDRIAGTTSTSNDLGTVLMTAHQADDAQLAAGVRAPMRTIDVGYDWSSLEKR